MFYASLEIISKITNGTLYGYKKIIINNVSINSKNIIPGCLFIAIVGKKFNAHNFYKEAIYNGCSALLVQQKISVIFPQILVKNTIIALSQIAKWHRKQINPLVIAITGSVGKTTVKEMTASILNHYGKTLYTQDNFNNLIGVSITLLRLKKSHKFAVIELGANKPREIYSAVKIVHPFIVLINNIYPVHLEGFKSLSGISKAKQEIFSGMSRNGIVIINYDSNDWKSWKKKLKKSTVLFFSMNKKKIIFIQKK